MTAKQALKLIGKAILWPVVLLAKNVSFKPR
jgi:hypothetical protein